MDALATLADVAGGSTLVALRWALTLSLVEQDSAAVVRPAYGVMVAGGRLVPVATVQDTAEADTAGTTLLDLDAPPDVREAGPVVLACARVLHGTLRGMLEEPEDDEQALSTIGRLVGVMGDLTSVAVGANLPAVVAAQRRTWPGVALARYVEVGLHLGTLRIGGWRDETGAPLDWPRTTSGLPGRWAPRRPGTDGPGWPLVHRTRLDRRVRAARADLMDQVGTDVHKLLDVVDPHLDRPAR